MSTIHTLDELLEVATSEMERAIATSLICYYEKPANGYVGVDDIGDLENLPPALEKFITKIDLTNADETNLGTPVAAPTTTYLLNLGDELWVRTIGDVSYLSDKTREQFTAYYIEALNRIVQGDDSVVNEFNPFI